MVITEIRTLNGVQYRYTYSDEGRYLVNSQGALYEEAYDPIDIVREYSEGEVIPIEPTEEELAEAGRIMMGYEHN